MDNVVRLKTKSDEVRLQAQFANSVRSLAINVQKLAENTEKVFHRCVQAEMRLLRAEPSTERSLAIEHLRECQKQLIQSMRALRADTAKFTQATKELSPQ